MKYGLQPIYIHKHMRLTFILSNSSIIAIRQLYFSTSQYGNAELNFVMNSKIDHVFSRVLMGWMLVMEITGPGDLGCNMPRPSIATVPHMGPLLLYSTRSNRSMLLTDSLGEIEWYHNLRSIQHLLGLRIWFALICCHSNLHVSFRINSLIPYDKLFVIPSCIAEFWKLNVNQIILTFTHPWITTIHKA